MRNRFLMLVVVMATLFACNSDSMTDGVNETAEKRSSVPFKVKKMSGTFEYGPGIENSIFCDKEANPALFGLNAYGEGTISHLGLSTVLEEWCWSIPDFLTIGDIGERKITFTAANGDQLWGTIKNIVYPDFPLSFDTFIEEVTIDGGTGRFENANGTITQTIITFPDTPGAPFGTFSYTAEGTISY